VIWALLFTVYSAVLAAFSLTSLVGVLLVPAQVPHALESGFDSFVAFLAAVPDPVRVIVLPLLSSTALLAFRATTISARSNLGGALFGGLVMLALLGLAATAAAPPWGTLVAAPGFIAAGVILYEFCDTVIRVRALSGPSPDEPQAGIGGPPSLVRLFRAAGRYAERLHPARSQWPWLVFLLVPPLATLILVTAVFAYHSNASWFRPIGSVALLSLVGWAVWACVATPAAVRIPIWSGLGWLVLFANFVHERNTIAYTFGVAGLAVIVINAVIFVHAKQSSAVGRQDSATTQTSDS
jgi:hypothetical protein